MFVTQYDPRKHGVGNWSILCKLWHGFVILIDQCVMATTKLDKWGFQSFLHRTLLEQFFWLEIDPYSWNLHCRKLWHSVSFATHFAVIQEWRNVTTQETEVDNRKTEIILFVIFPRLWVFLIHRCWSIISVCC